MELGGKEVMVDKVYGPAGGFKYVFVWIYDGLESRKFFGMGFKFKTAKRFGEQFQVGQVHRLAMV